MVLLPNLAAVRISGADAGDFLHNQLSSDVLALSENESTFACYCEPKGRVLALMLVSRSDDDYLVIMSGELAASISKRLKIYVMRSKVNIDVLDECSIVGLHSNEETQSPLEKLVAVAIPKSGDSFIIATGNGGLSPAPEQAGMWKLAELQAGISWLCTETSGQFLPQMLGFDQIGAVNYRKGCYPGQEIVARTHYLGKVKRHPRLVCTDASIFPNPMDKLQILSTDQSYVAVIADSADRAKGGACIFVVTRMDPDLAAEKIEYQGQEAELIVE